MMQDCQSVRPMFLEYPYDMETFDTDAFRMLVSRCKEKCNQELAF